MIDDLQALRSRFERAFRGVKKYVLVDEAAFFVGGCGCHGLRIRPAGLRVDTLNAQGQQVVTLLSTACEQGGLTPTLGYVRLVPGSHDLIDSLYMVAACAACAAEIEENQGLVPMIPFYRKGSASEPAV